MIPVVGAALQFGMMPKFQESLDAQRNARNNARAAYDTAKSNAKAAGASADRCLRASSCTDQCTRIIPEAIQKTETSLARAEQVRKPVITLQSLFQALSTHVGKIDNEGEDTGYSNKKESIIGDILDVIDYGLVDSSLTDNARRVIREIKMGDDQGLTSKQALAGAFAALERKMQDVGPINRTNKEVNQSNFTPVISHRSANEED